VGGTRAHQDGSARVIAQITQMITQKKDAELEEKEKAPAERRFEQCVKLLVAEDFYVGV